MPHDISVKTVRKFVEKVSWAKVAEKAANAEKGQRLFPSRTPKNDSDLNFRIDKGADVGGKPELVLQANRNAKDKKVKEAAQQDSHQILAKAVVDPKDNTSVQNAGEAMMASFSERK